MPPSNHLLMTGYIHWAVESPRKMTRRSPFQEGKVGSREANHPSLKFTSWGKSSLWTTAAITMSAMAGPDMGQLITALTSGQQISTPKISTFSGNVAPSKTEVSYEQWSHEVQCIKDHYPESVVRESIMWSLKGAAADMLAIWALLPVSPKFWRNSR